MNYNTYPTNTMLPDSFDRFHVEKLDYLPAGSYQPMPVRPYTFSPTDHALGQIVDRMDRFKSGSVTTGILSGLTEGILAPSAVGFDSAVNAQWVATPRYAFFLKVRSFDAVGLEECHYIFGFTDQEGVSPINGATNPEMVFTINNVITTGAYTIQTPMGLQRQEKLLSHFNTIHSTQGENLYTQRPLDISKRCRCSKPPTTWVVEWSPSQPKAWSDPTPTTRCPQRLRTLSPPSTCPRS